ncbi:MAG: flavodoxin-dependent (E)-4-hydroxy-3-methylbut-2-enyl-diphosphate synthase, partial [Flavobacteriales bacterium]
YIGEQLPEFPLPQTLGVIRDYKAWLKDGSAPNHFPIMDAEEFLHAKTKSAALNLVDVGSAIAYEGLPDSICNDPTTVLLLRSSRAEVAEKLMNLLTSKAQSNPTAPVIIASEYCDLSSQEFLASASCELGGLLIDGFGDGIFIMQGNCCSPQFAAASAFGILQCSRRRITETDYISCPSCGRTLFDLQETTKKIHARTGHLKGLKIGIMGCIVNGPGEMADADYGYVGTGPGVITLYKGREVVKRNIPEHNAVEALLELIKANGDWQDAPSIIADSTSNK